MVMDFWAAQRRARRLTSWFVFLFALITLATAGVAEFAMRSFAGEDYHPPLPYVAMAFAGVTCLVALFQYAQFRLQGGSYVAEAVGGIRIDPRQASAREQQLLNIVEEVCVASGLPMPAVYLLPANEINAFAAGLNPKDAAIAVTVGALNKLNRDELQGVIAHEIGHVGNGDMTISMRVAALVMGFFFVLYIAMRMLQMSDMRSSREDRRGGNPLALAALILMVAGAFTWFAGSVLKSMISRQREYLADASSAQYTRNPEALANALRKIAAENKHDMPASGMAFSHMYFEDTTFMSALFATHPPIAKRIAALEGKNIE